MSHDLDIWGRRCFACKQAIPLPSDDCGHNTDGLFEWHHWIPRRAGGSEVLPLCITCHNLVDRHRCNDLDVGFALEAVKALCDGGPELRNLRLMGLKLMAVWADHIANPEVIR